MEQFDIFHKHLTATIECLPNYLSIEEGEEIIIVDYKGQSYIVAAPDENEIGFSVVIDNMATVIDELEAEKHYKISNHKRKTGFIPIDGKKGLLGYGESYCDCVFFDDADFCFVEFKMNATSTEVNAIRKNRWKAVSQLGNTINYFDEKLNKDYKGLMLEAYVCTPDTYPRQDTAWQSIEVAFLEKYGVPLYESRYKKCR